MALDFFGIILEVSAPNNASLSISNSVGYYGCPISNRAMQRGMALRAFAHAAAISASDAAPRTGFRILASACIRTLKNFCCCDSGLVSSGILPRKWKPLTLLLNFDTDKHEPFRIFIDKIEDCIDLAEAAGAPHTNE